MADSHVSTPEDHAGADQPQTNPPRRAVPDTSELRSPGGSTEHRPRPRTRPPSYHAPAAPRVYESQSLSERILPPLFFAFLLLTVVACAAVLIWKPSPKDEYVLSSEELRVLNGNAPPPVDQTKRTSIDPVGDAAAETAGLRIETALPGAMVSIDGEVMGVTPFQVRNMPARWHIVTLERPGFTAVDTLVYLQEDALTSVSVELTPRSEDRVAPLAIPRDDRIDIDDAEPADTPATPPRTEEPDRVEPPSPETAPPSAPAFGSISVAVNPAGVPVQLDGQTVGVAPIELSDVEPGARTLTFFLPGYETATVRLDVKPGVNEVVDIAMVPQTGTLVVVARPWGSIYINGELRAQDTDVSVEVVLPVGNHQVRVVHPSLGVQERTVEVQPDATTMASFNLN